MASAGARSVPRLISVTSAVSVLLCLVAAAVSWRRGLLYCAVPLLVAVPSGLLPLHFTNWGASHKRALTVAAIVGAMCGVAVVVIVLVLPRG